MVSHVSVHITGVKDITKKGEMVEWHGKAVVDFWKDRNASSHCNKVTGNDPSSLPLHLTSRDVIPSYIGQLCRRIDFEYVKEVRERYGYSRLFRCKSAANPPHPS